eukprot:TRINITY_DN18382_c0_g1_i1.p1 TRINITY_DN18382_c0_g1~~TRINITY_DN18382_c0_g1_i1.p1  ORF type:complete len:723 (-),score=135.52 TRINITY_DN18382_c0_g1_i1:207-2375(-)
MVHKKQMQRKAVETADTERALNVSADVSDTAATTKKVKKKNRKVLATEHIEADVGSVQAPAVSKKKSKKKHMDVAGSDLPTDASTDVLAVTNSKEKGKKSHDAADIPTGANDANTIAQSPPKKNKRKLDAVQSTDADEQQDSEVQKIPNMLASQRKAKKNMARKAARQLLLQLGQVQTLLQDVQTNSQLEEALSALRSLRAANVDNQKDSKEQSSRFAEVGQSVTSIHPAAQESAEKTVDADAPQAADATKQRRQLESAVQYSFAEWPLVNEKKASKRRAALSVEIEDGGSVPPPILAFSELQVLPTWMDKALEENNWSKPTAIQAQALPILLSGKNIVGVAQTGSGKTGAFLIPAIVHIDAQAQLTKRSRGPVALILAPTRELAVQIGEEADKLLKYSTQSTNHPQGIFSACFYGGGRKQDQLWRFSSSGRHIVVATPGRLADCVTAGEVSVSRVTYLVLDEADRMLDEGFSGEVGQILSGVRTERQVALFSATWPTSVQELAKAVMPGQCAPVRIRVGGSAKASEEGALQARKGITQEVIVIDYPSSDWQKAAEEKSRLMEAHVRKVLTSVADSKMLVFVNTKVQADDLSTKLWKEGFQADSMHGGRPQETRLNVLRRFREGQLRLLVVTDVFARGLDIPQVSHVVIFEMGETEDYIHRIGRTGRGVGGTGHALVFFEYWPGYPAGAEELIGVLERSEQKVPEALRRIAADVNAGNRPTR